ncbi:hypothetical protein AGMMS50262_23820 [Bacteroidia bacterium]|nr:hypothetical protein AGMMS50262_23820 [Bacteroidia bacterium]
MRSIAELYTDAMRQKYGMVYAAWKLGNHYELGDYGFLNDNVFERQGNVKQLGFDFEILKDPNPSDENYKSTGVNKNKITADGSTVVAANANAAVGFSIEFSNANTVFYEAMNVRTNKIDDVAKLGAEIKRIYSSGNEGENGVKWDKKFAVITELDVADSATIILSNTQNAKIELRANANISVAQLNIADPKCGWDRTSETGLESYIIANEGATPLFKLMGLKKRFLGAYIFKGQAFDKNDSKTEQTEVLDFVEVIEQTWTGV